MFKMNCLQNFIKECVSIYTVFYRPHYLQWHAVNVQLGKMAGCVHIKW